jgi:hypothetical protein
MPQGIPPSRFAAQQNSAAVLPYHLCKEHRAKDEIILCRQTCRLTEKTVETSTVFSLR